MRRAALRRAIAGATGLARRVLEEMDRTLPDPPVRPTDPSAAEALRRRASCLDEWPPPPADDTVSGVRFDVARNTWITARVHRVASWAWRLRLRQFLDWDLPCFRARQELRDRLVHAAPFVDAGRLSAFLTDLADASTAEDRDFASILDAPVPLQFSADDAGDTPKRVTWQLPPSLVAALFRTFEDGSAAARLRQTAVRERHALDRELAPRRAAMRPLFGRYRGVPALHKRGHWALVNLANAGQSVAEMRRDGGVLPRSQTRLDPARHAAPVKLRFVLNDRLEINVLDDGSYWDVIRRWGFPPNHELLSIARPILAAGYLTLDRGHIIGLEDDGLMIPGKLPPGLPPMQETLEALGYPIDREQLARHALVLDWEAFAAHAQRGGPALDVAPDVARERLIAASYADRPALAAAFVRGADAAKTAAALRGFRLINVGGRAVADGDLPKNAEWIDESIAACLVRKARP